MRIAALGVGITLIVFGMCMSDLRTSVISLSAAIIVVTATLRMRFRTNLSPVTMYFVGMLCVCFWTVAVLEIEGMNYQFITPSAVVGAIFITSGTQMSIGFDGGRKKG